MKIDIFYDAEEKSTKFRLLENVKVDDFIIPEDFCSDGASVPEALWRLLHTDRWEICEDFPAS